ncbi:unnamed protein product [Mucor hiemalis]
MKQKTCLKRQPYKVHTTSFANRAASIIASRTTTQIDYTSEDESVVAESTSSYRILLNSHAVEFKEEDEIFKSLTSGCIHMANECCQTYYKAIFIQNQNEAILRKCEEMRNLELNEGQTKINKVFDALLPCRFHRNTEKALIILDDLKSAEKDKKYLFYVVLCILYNTSSPSVRFVLYNVVNNFKYWTNEDNHNEAMYVRKFEDILEFLFTETDLTVRDREGVSKSTRRMQIMNDYDLTYGRRIDLLISGDSNEVASIEFKKKAVSNTVSLYQQSKNIRINGCILNQIHLMTDSTDDTVLYYDCIGRDSYLCQLFEFQVTYICQKLYDISIPKTLIE